MNQLTNFARCAGVAREAIASAKKTNGAEMSKTLDIAIALECAAKYRETGTNDLMNAVEELRRLDSELQAIKKQFEDQKNQWLSWDSKRKELEKHAELAQAQILPVGWKLLKSPITEDMHVEACKVMFRATGVDGLPQRMLDAMLAASPAQPVQPLTKDQVSQMLQAAGYDAASTGEQADFINGIRHAEIAHGIAACQPVDELTERKAATEAAEKGGTK